MGDMSYVVAAELRIQINGQHSELLLGQPSRAQLWSSVWRKDQLGRL